MPQHSFVSTRPADELVEAWRSALLAARMQGVAGWLRGDISFVRVPANEVPNDGFTRPAPLFAQRARIPFGRFSGTGCEVDLVLWDGGDQLVGVVVAESPGLGSRGHLKYFAASRAAVDR